MGDLVYISSEQGVLIIGTELIFAAINLWPTITINFEEVICIIACN